ncbi:hypothetical protein [Acetobacter pasteurianus]|uniref:hypothetical protein n=1 Tax=Acetobacter pasteurianus TaxID=438 RepID=UPI003D114DC1
MARAEFIYNPQEENKSYAALMKHLKEHCQKEWYCEAISQKPESIAWEATIVGDHNELFHASLGWPS